MKFDRVLAVFYSLPLLCAGLNILGLAPNPSPSHHNWNRQIWYKLASQGHNVTVLSADIDQETTPNLHYIHAEKVYSMLYNGSSFRVQDFSAPNPFAAVLSLYDYFRGGCAGLYASEGFRRLLRYPDSFKFDLVVAEFLMEPCILGFLDKFGYPPVVGLCPFSIVPWIYETIGGHRQPAYVPHYAVKFGTSMTFYERIVNFLVYAWEDVYRYFVFVPHQEKLMRMAFENPQLPSSEELTSRVIVALVNSHFSIEKTEPLPPNVIPVSGLQIQEPQPLERSLEEFVQSARKGVVFFSLGTNMKSEFLEAGQKSTFIETFRLFPDFHFIWKYESDIGVPLPANVRTVGWARQNDILAHPRTKAFISHCGLLSTQEAAWHGVPVVGVPVFGDQHRNIRVGVKEGTSVHVDFKKLTVDSLKAALVEVLSNPSYSENARRRSRLQQDLPRKPIDTVIFWIEWVLRNQDSYQAIQLPIRDLGVVVSNSVDVIAALIVVLVIVIRLAMGLLKTLLGRKKSTRAKQKAH